MFSIDERTSSFKIAAALFVFAVLLYLPSLGSGYVGWDDALILDDSRIRSLAPDNLLSLLSPGAGWSMTYQPVRILAYALVYSVSGTEPVGFLVLNLLLYATTVLLFFFLVRGLLVLHARDLSKSSLLSVPLVAASIFALHPLNVESVSWLQGGKMALMGVFFTGSLLAYVRFRSEDRTLWLVASFILYLFSLASQPGAVAFPLVILAYELAFPPRGGQTGTGKPWIRVAFVGLFFLPMLAAVVQLVFLSTVTQVSQAGSSPTARVFNLPLLWNHYLLKFVLPVNICCRYPFVVPEQTPFVSGTLGFLLLAGLSRFAVRQSGAPRVTAFGLAFAAVALLPTSGLVPTSTLMADRYFFLPGMGLSLVAGILLVRMWNRAALRGPAQRRLVVAAMALVALGFGGINLLRQLDWRSPYSLWGRVLDVYPDHSLAAFNLAEAHQRAGDIVRAAELYSRVTRLNPGYGDAWANLAVLTRARGDSTGALEMLHRAAELRPDRGAIWVNIGISHAGLGEDSLALTAFNRAIELADKWQWQGYYNRSKLFLSLGDKDRALTDIEQTARTWPGRISSEAWLDLGRTLERMGEIRLATELMSLGEGAPSFNAECLRALGNLQLLDNRPDEAVRTLERALRDDPSDYRTLVLLGAAGHQSGDYALSLDYYGRAFRAPGADRARTLDYTALSLAAAGRNVEALDAWRRALDVNSSLPEIWINLGLFHRGLGEEENAVRCISRAIELCGDNPGLEPLRARLNDILNEKNAR